MPARASPTWSRLHRTILSMASSIRLRVARIVWSIAHRSPIPVVTVRCSCRPSHHLDLSQWFLAFGDHAEAVITTLVPVLLDRR